MTYRAPVEDILFTINHVAGGAEGLSEDVTAAVIEEAGAFAEQEIAPLNVVGDRKGTRFENGEVKTAPGWREVYRRWCSAGWNGVSAPEEHGGQGLPLLLWAATTDIWNAASVAFGIGPILTQGTIEALEKHGSEELKRIYLSKVVSGEWTGTMNLTEPQAGSDLSALTSRAERAGDGTYRIRGTKIFITYGEHDLTDNIVHMVLARLPDAPPGTKGISLFLVPKVIDGARNDVRCTGVEHKMGIHASPTCTMAYGDAGGAVGYLVGEENRGLACMFTMMNNARLAVGLQGVAVAERATQAALAYARERRQGRAAGYAGEGMSPIILHPDLRRMLLTMRALTGAARAICYQTAHALDGARRGEPGAQELANLLTPVAKAFSTDIGAEVASLGVQVHGGMGYIEETGAAQHFRDARIFMIYEGTNGIQAIDLVTRKISQGGGEVVRRHIRDLREQVEGAIQRPEFGNAGKRLGEAVESLNRATEWLLESHRTQDEALAGATPYLRLYGLAAGGCALAKGALSAGEPGRVQLARFFAEHLATAAPGLAMSVMEGADSVGMVG